MGIFSHNKTWRFLVNAPPDACVRAFSMALTQGKGALNPRKANWAVDRSGNTAVGTYQGRGGAAKVMTMFSSRSTEIEEIAIGSRITFEVESFDEAAGRATCAMWLSQAGTKLGMTADSGFFRSYMSQVESALRDLDPTMQTDKVS